MKSMACPLNDRKDPAILLDYVSRRLDAAEMVVVDRHAVECPPCQEFIAEQMAVWSALDQLEAPAVSPEFDERLYARIADQSRDWWGERLWRAIFESGEPGNWRPAAILSTACAVVLAVALVQSPVPQMTGSGIAKIESAKVVSGGELPDVELVESALEDVEMLKLVNSGSTL